MRPPRISLRTLGVICGTATELHTHTLPASLELKRRVAVAVGCVRVRTYTGDADRGGESD